MAFTPFSSPVLSAHKPREQDEYQQRIAEHGEESASSMRRGQENAAKAWIKIVEEWPREDRFLIRDWLVIASQWEFVKQLYDSNVEVGISFWSQRD